MYTKPIKLNFNTNLKTKIKSFLEKREQISNINKVQKSSTDFELMKYKHATKLPSYTESNSLQFDPIESFEAR